MQTQCDALIAEIEDEVRATASSLGFSRLSPAVLAALRAVPRHAFVPADRRALAYRNHPLPIGAGQTISQPYIVAIVSELLQVGPGDRVLELGGGSGYQAAVLAAMGVSVYALEIVPELAERARLTLSGLGYLGVEVRTGDGWLGWPEAAPFDAIVVSAAAPRIPEPLVEQLKPGGRLAIPLGKPWAVQQLGLYRKDLSGQLTGRSVLAVRFVPVTGEQVG
jgi:protein-L-isoaspartate(D-aspartate) O-methyltransferase